MLSWCRWLVMLLTSTMFLLLIFILCLSLTKIAIFWSPILILDLSISFCNYVSFCLICSIDKLNIC
jgi:hypothetical protein